MLRSIDDVLAGRSCNMGRHFNTSSDAIVHYHMAGILNNHARAFNLGFISCQRLLETSFPPFIKTARQLNQAEVPDGVASIRVSASMCAGMGAPLSGMLSVEVIQDSQGMVQPALLSLRKRAEFVRALLKSKAPEMRKLWALVGAEMCLITFWKC